MPLTTGCHHVALVTQDLDRFVDFWTGIFDGEVVMRLEEDGLRHALVDLGNGFALHPFAFDGGNPHERGGDTVFDRGHLDHVALRVEDADDFAEVRRRLVEAGASDGLVTDFGPLRSVWFTDPDGLGCEVATPAVGAPRRFAARGREPYAPTVGG